MASPTITFRLSVSELVLLDDIVRKKKQHYACPGDYAISHFIRQAIAEKIAHMERSRRAKEKKPRQKSRVTRVVKIHEGCDICGDIGCEKCWPYVEAI
jgi:hypothetical protein